LCCFTMSVYFVVIDSVRKILDKPSYSPKVAMHLAERCCLLLLETFLELLLFCSFQRCRHIF